MGNAREQAKEESAAAAYRRRARKTRQIYSVLLLAVMGLAVLVAVGSCTANNFGIKVVEHKPAKRGLHTIPATPTEKK